ncbi:MAG: signal peptidase I [Paracoccus sp. (in: a-proteobacteria)]|uniref:signal peptidase I n=1 Tax=Paracoccus sp. TaxID=267 RepID=UPI0039E47260
MAKSNARKDGGIWETIKTIFWALIIAGIFRTLFFQPFWIPSGSMKDTLLIGDFLFVNKMAYGYSSYSCPLKGSHIPGTDIAINLCPFSGRILGAEPQRGDVVVFRHARGDDFIKRLIGLPGDRIQMRDGTAYINGVAAPQVPAGEFVEAQQPQGPQGSLPCPAGIRAPQDGQCVAPRLTETLPNGVSHDVLNLTDGGPGDNTEEFLVPEGQYFFMGDNRDNSGDSRWPASRGGAGMVPADRIIGRADRIMFSSAGKSLLYFWTWRADRFLKAVD